jgi:hypothetical protein
VRARLAPRSIAPGCCPPTRLTTRVGSYGAHANTYIATLPNARQLRLQPEWVRVVAPRQVWGHAVGAQMH